MGGLIDNTSHAAPTSGAFVTAPKAQPKPKPAPVISSDVAAAARKSNEVDDSPDSAFRNIGTGTGLGYIAGDTDGAQSHAIESAFARKAIKDLLPGGTDLLVDNLKKMMRQQK